MSIILAIETSTEHCSVALLSEAGTQAVRTHAGQRHSEIVLEMVATVLARAGLALGDCSAIAFGAGPGSFTGLRIACAVAQGLAWARDLPVIAVSTLVALAEQCRVEDPRAFPSGTRVLAALDARMGELYWSILEWTGAAWMESPGPSLSAPAQLAASAPGGVTFGCGSAFEVFGGSLSALVGTVRGPLVPDASAVASLGERLFAAGAALPAALAAPIYVRDHVARTIAERRATAETGP